MSKAKVPTLQRGASRADLISFREETRSNGRAEFERGVTADEVYARVFEKAGVPLPAIRSMLNAEYFSHLGVNLIKIRTLSAIAGMAAFFVMTMFAPQGSPITRVLLPMLIALVLAFLVQNLLIGASKRSLAAKSKEG